MELRDNTVIIVLGASGDLAKKKTVSNSCQPSSEPDPLRIAHCFTPLGSPDMQPCKMISSIANSHANSFPPSLVL